MNRIDAKFQQAKDEGRAIFSIYICAGDPDLETTKELVLEFDRVGVDLIELGVPFSDPVADGPVIQNAIQRALEGGTTLRKSLDTLRSIRTESEIPITLMTYYNPVFHYGIEALVKDAVAAGADGLIVPDLTPEESEDLVAAARAQDCKTIFFTAPTSTDERVRITNEAATGFIYCVSVTGITGARESLPEELVSNLERFRNLTDKPLVVGFGVSRPDQVRMLSKHADGIIVGSAIVRKIEENLSESREVLVRRVGELAAELAGGVR
ncbi:MAG: tryptophan synthase subunit alpha [Planctomycetota bacterium]|nr:tryptophan synthase subunit alpha [Planctomycetota bacterium]MDA1140486.1 tryptophan synthase subunit alpha [Planctomycetota bacterium]